ncbi:MAG: HNH endonuclease [Syntrophobacteraceae bacterium]
MPPKINTVRQHIAWSYANLARAHSALQDGVSKYKTIHHIIRNKLYHGFVSGKMSMRSLYDDERLKMIVSQACFYCGSRLNLAVDHLIPRIKGGSDESDNLIWACRKCNSSKQGRDMLLWMQSKGIFPPVLLLRRYMKIVAHHCEEHGHMDMELSQAGEVDMPFDLRLLPVEFPPLSELKLWAYPEEEYQ